MPNWTISQSGMTTIGYTHRWSDGTSFDAFLAHFNACDTLLGKIEHLKDLKSSVSVSAATAKIMT